MTLFPGFQQYIASSYPGITLQPLNGTVFDLLDAIGNGTCAGGLAPDVAVNYALGPLGDAAGQYCGLETVGELLTSGMYSIPFNCAPEMAPHKVHANDGTGYLVLWWSGAPMRSHFLCCHAGAPVA